VALTNVVVSALLLKFTTDVETNSVPVTVSVNAVPPAACVWPASVALLIVGRGLLTVNVSATEGPTAGAGFVTVTLNVPAVATSAAVIAAVTFVLLTKVVVLALPLKLTVAPFTKELALPFTVSVNAASPAVALGGESEARIGCTLSFVRAKLAGVATPVTFAVTVYVPPVPLAVNAADAATPLALVVAVLIPPANVPLAPAPGAANVTIAPLTGLFPVSNTVATNGAANTVLMVAVCGVPEVGAMLAGGPGLFVREKFAAVATPVTFAVTV